jgi:phosphoglycerol transferase MdoB-like AlkP superfamily enzyme
MEFSPIYHIGWSNIFGDILAEPFSFFIDLLSKLVIKAFYRSTGCELSCEKTVNVFVALTLIAFMVVLAISLGKALKKKKAKPKRSR